MKAFYETHLKAYFEDDVVVISVIFLFAFIVRLIFIPHLIFDPAFLHPVVDCKEHNDLAFKLLNLNDWRITEFWYHTPGYAYFVAVVYKILGHSVVRLAIVQYVLGSLCACLLYYIVKRLMNRWAAIFGAFLMSVYWLLIYTQAHVYSENLSMLFNLLMVYFLMFSADSWRKYLLSGLLLGLSVVVRPEILPFSLMILFWFLIKNLPFKKAALYYGLFVLGVALCVLPLMFKNYQFSGDFLIRKQIGVNFYMGSMPEYKGSNIYVSIGQEWSDVISIPYQEQNIDVRERMLSEKEINSYYVRKVLDFIKNNPLDWAAFMAGKVFSVVIGIDFLRTEDVYFYDKYIRSTPFSLIQTWFICILAVVGMFLSFLKEPKKYSLLYLFLGAYLCAMFFTYKTRYLVSHMPLIIIFSSYSFSYILEAIKKRNLRQFICVASAVLVLYGCVKWNPIDIVWPSKSEMHYVIGLSFDFYRDHDRAEEYYLKAIAEDPGNISALNYLGELYLDTGEYQKAISRFEQAVDVLDVEKYRNNYYLAVYYFENGGEYNSMKRYPEEFRKRVELYNYYFPIPYRGAIYQKNDD